MCSTCARLDSTRLDSIDSTCTRLDSTRLVLDSTRHLAEQQPAVLAEQQPEVTPDMPLEAAIRKCPKAGWSNATKAASLSSWANGQLGHPLWLTAADLAGVSDIELTRLPKLPRRVGKTGVQVLRGWLREQLGVVVVVRRLDEEEPLVFDGERPSVNVERAEARFLDDLHATSGSTFTLNSRRLRPESLELAAKGLHEKAVEMGLQAKGSEDEEPHPMTFDDARDLEELAAQARRPARALSLCLLRLYLSARALATRWPHTLELH